MKILLVILTLLSLGNQLLLASQNAVVVSKEAVIYADIEMTSPIGYISKGKKIKVGEIPRNKGRVLPVIVSGQVAYVMRKDIETNVALLHFREAQKRSTNFQLQKRHAAKFETFYTSFNDRDYHGFGFRGVKHNHLTKEVFRTSFTALEGTYEERPLTMYDIAMDYGKILIDASYLHFSVFAGLHLLPYAHYEIFSTLQRNGYGAGWSIGAETSFMMASNWRLDLEGRISEIHLAGFHLPDEFSSDFSPLINDTLFTVGFSYFYEY